MEGGSIGIILSRITSPLSDTLKKLKRHWACDLRDHYIPSAYVKSLVDHYGCQLVSKATPNDTGGMSIVKYKKTSPIEVIEVQSLKLNDTLKYVQTKYHVHAFAKESKRVCV